MYNLLQIQDKLKDMSDSQLAKYMGNPDGSAPPYLVLSEMNRRANMREAHKAQQAQAPSSSMAEELTSKMGGGIMGLGNAKRHQNQNSMPHGMQSFQDGGEVESPKADVMTWWERVGRTAFWPEMKMGEWLGERYKQGVDTGQEDTSSMRNWLTEMWADEEESAPMGTTDMSRADLTIPLAGGPFFTPGGERSAPPAAPESFPDFPGYGVSAPQMAASPDISSLLGDEEDYLSPIAAKIAGMAPDTEAMRDDAITNALLRAGFSMMATDSPHFAQGVGQGALAGLDEYQSGMDDIDAREREQLGYEMTIAEAQQAEARGDRAEAIELYKHAERMKMDQAQLDLRAQIASQPPAEIQLMQWYSKLSPEQRKVFADTKREIAGGETIDPETIGRLTVDMLNDENFDLRIAAEEERLGRPMTTTERTEYAREQVLQAMGLSRGIMQYDPETGTIR